ITGSPRLDRLINDGQTLRSKIRALLGVTCDEKLLLYAPTWRGGVSSHDFDVERLFQDLKAMSHTAGTRVFFRAHRLTEKFVNNLSLPVDVVPNEIDSSDLLAAVDILVTDYSSIAFDFLPTRRHLIFYVPDYNEYIESRGLYIDIDSLPGRVCHDHKSLIDSIADSSGSMLDAYDAAIERYAPMEDGNASARTIDFMLESDVAQSRSRPLVVFHASLIPNGIATALLALLRRLGSHKVDVVLVVEAHVMRREPGRQAMLAKLPEYVDLAFRIDEITATPEERWAISRAKSLESLGSTAMREVLDVAWRREGYRVLGAVVPDTVIEFDGYADLWADFVANLGDESTTRLIWQHNQLAEERRTKYPELARVFKRYDQFSAIVPVAESLATENQRQLSLEGFQTSTPYVPVTNLLDTERIKSAAAEPLSSDVDKWMTPDAFNVISIGRLSPEKNFGALIDAWPAIVSAVPNARLTIIGSGLL